MSINILERAISKLELMSVDAAPRPWVVEPDHYVSDLTVILTEHEYESHQDRILVADYMHKHTAQMVLALSRAVDPLIALLELAESIGGDPIVERQTASAAFVKHAVALARAVLGEVSR